MKVILDIDDFRIERMYDKHCEKTNCEECSAQVMIGDDYLGCFDKYKNEVFENEFKKIIEKFITLVDEI